MSKPTVLLAAPHFPPEVGGVEQYVWHLARTLRARHGYRVVVATTARSRGGAGAVLPGNRTGPAAHGGAAAHDSLAADGDAEGLDEIPVYRLPSPLRVSRTPVGAGWQARLREIIEAEHVDLVNAHAPVPLFADAAARASGDTPFVLTYHTGRMGTNRPLLDLVGRVYERTLLVGTVGRAREVVCSSDFAAADQPHLFAGRAVTISPGVDLGLFTDSPVPAAPRILFSASLEKATSYKGLPDLLEAVRLLADSVAGLRLDVAGAGSAEAGYRRLADRLGVGGVVAFRGRLDRSEMAAAYRDARVLALPSHFDSFPSVLVEALASGRPVVATRVGGIPSLVDHGANGLLVEPGDTVALAAALRTVLTDDALAARLGAAGRAHVAETLSWDRQSDRTVEVFERAMQPGRRVRTVAVVAPYYPPKVGGVENYAEHVAQAVAAAPGLRAAVITTAAGRRTTVGLAGGLPTVRLGAWARLSNTPVNPLWPLQVRGWLRRLDADLVHAHAPVPGLADVALAVSGRRPTVLTYHAGSMLKGRRGPDLAIGAYERRLLPRLFDRARVLVAVSPVSLAAARPGAVRISPGVDLDRFVPGPPPSGRPPTVTYVGRMDRTSEWKGVGVLLHAFAELAAAHPAARLRLVGGGDAVAGHRRLAERLGVADRLELPGELVGDDLVRALHSSAVLALPSRTAAESFGMVLAEAMACGTPVVGSDVGGIPYLVTHRVTGLLVPPGDPGALAAACTELLVHADLADALGAAGRRHVAEHYAWPGLTARYVSLFRSLLADEAEAEPAAG